MRRNKLNSLDSSRLSPLITTVDLGDILIRNDVIVIDTRQGKDAYSAYLKGHIKGALWADLETDLATPSDAKNGGRHPLPALEGFQQSLSNLGIEPTSHVILYDNSSGAIASARFWWMLRSIGHEKVQVLDGGLASAQKANLPMATGSENPAPPSKYSIESWQLPLADIDAVRRLSDNGEGVIIDVRAPERYEGTTEPIDPIAGHIPGAVNIPFRDNLDEDGLFLNPEILRTKYEQILSSVSPQNQVVHCGSGVTACHTLLALDYAGIGLPKLYVGSWSEWCRNEVV